MSKLSKLIGVVATASTAAIVALITKEKTKERKHGTEESILDKKLERSSKIVADISKMKYIVDKTSRLVCNDEKLTEEMIKSAIDSYISIPDKYSGLYPYLDGGILVHIRECKPENREQMLHIVGRGFCIVDTEWINNYDDDIRKLAWDLIGYREEIEKYLIDKGIDENWAGIISFNIGNGNIFKGKCAEIEKIESMILEHDISEKFIFMIQHIEYIPRLADIEEYTDILLRCFCQRDMNMFVEKHVFNPS